MKKGVVASFTVMLLGIIHSADTGSYSFQPPLSRTGAPGEQTCMNGCHTGGAGTGTVSITFGSGQTTYLPDSSYTVTVTVSDPSKTRFGFEVAALNGSDNNAGVCSIITPSNSGTMMTMGRTYVFHKSANSNNSWSFSWTAPSAGTGTVTFYAAGNAANGNGALTGDNIYTTTLSVNEGGSVGIDNETSPESVKVYPSPAAGNFHIRLSEPAGSCSIVVFASDGRQMLMNYEAEQVSAKIFHFNTEQRLATGVYYLKVTAGGTHLVKKIFIGN